MRRTGRRADAAAELRTTSCALARPLRARPVWPDASNTGRLAAAYREFQWPAFDEFNWVLDYFEVIACGNDRPALRVVDDAERTAGVMRDGHYQTGDVASRDADGYLTYIGRVDDVFKSSDYRIRPFELESVLIEHVAVAAAVPSADPLRRARGIRDPASRTQSGCGRRTLDFRAHPLTRFHVQAHPAPRVQYASEDDFGQDSSRGVTPGRAGAPGCACAQSP